jgi:hypothetical protein
MLYNLTEAYSEIYDHRKVEDLFDNLRFVDYLQDEDIQEVVEELVWEFRDYGNTLEEAFEMLDHAVTVPVLYESYDELIGDVLYEASRVDMAARIQARKQYMKDSEKAASQARATGRANQRAARISSAKQAVKSKLSGPISSVKQSISGAAGGMGRAAKALGGAAVKKGQAMLKSLLRRGGKALTSTGRSIEASGKAAAAAPATTRTAKVGRTTVTTTTAPGGAKRQMVGRAVRKVGAALQRKAGKAPDSKMTKADYDKRKADRDVAARTSVGDAFSAPAKKTTDKPSVVYPKPKKEPLLARDPSGNVLNTNRTTKALPAATSGRPAVQRTSPGITTARGVRATAKLKKAAVRPPSSGPIRALPPKGAGTFTSSGNIRLASQREFALSRAATQGKKALNREELDLLLQYISEDLIDAGYAYNIDEAYEIINDLDESTLTEIIYDYLEE